MAWYRCGLSGSGIPQLSQLIPRVSSADARITTSSDANNRAGWCAFNGVSPTNLREPNNNTCWLPSDNEANPYIQYAFSSAYRFTHLILMCFSNYSDAWTGNIEILGSNDGTTWTNVLASGTEYALTAPLQANSMIFIQLDNTLTWSYIRLKGKSAFAVPFNPSLFIDEIYVLGYSD